MTNSFLLQLFGLSSREEERPVHPEAAAAEHCCCRFLPFALVDSYKFALLSKEKMQTMTTFHILVVVAVAREAFSPSS